MPDQVPYIVYGLALLVLVGSGMFTRKNAGQNTRYLLIWAGIMVVGILGYNIYEDWKFRPSINADGDQVMRIPYDVQTGGFRVAFDANGQKIEGIIDTGASDVVLSYHDAKKVGVDVENLTFQIELSTANGRGRGASSRLDKLAFGDLAFFDVPIIVTEEGALETNLLGMSFLNRTKGFSANRDVLFIEF